MQACNPMDIIKNLETIEEHTADYEQILEEIGYGKTQWSMLIISGLLTLFQLSVHAVMSNIAIASQCEFEISQVQKGIMIATSVTGLFLSAYIWGFISDLFGRRAVPVYSTLFACALLFVSVFVTNIWLYDVINLLVGVCLGGTSGALYAYLSEFHTAKHRAIVINYSTMFVSVAAIYVPATAWLVLSFDWSLDLVLGITLRPWRLLIISCLLPGLISALWLLPFPESPKFLLAQNKEQEALEAVDWICRYNRGRPLLSFLKKTSIKLRPEKILDGNLHIKQGGVCGFLVLIWKATIPLFQQPHRRNFLMSGAAVFLMFFGAKGMLAWYLEIVNRVTEQDSLGSTTICELLGASFAKKSQYETQENFGEENNTVCVNEEISSKTYINNIILGCAYLVGFIIQGLLMQILSRKIVLLGALSLAALNVILLQFAMNSTFALIQLCLYIIMAGLAISTMLGAVVDLVPTSLRGKAVSFCSTLGFLGIIISANLIGVTLAPMCIQTFAIFAVSLLGSILLVCYLPV